MVEFMMELYESVSERHETTELDYLTVEKYRLQYNITY